MPFRTPMYAPDGSVCDKCGGEINRTNPGRRYRMKPVHEKCLPETRQKKIRMR